MKGNLIDSILYSAILILLLASCNGSHDHATSETYTCPMHPSVISDKPGACPVCGMDLVRKARSTGEVEISEDLSKQLKSTSQAILSTIKTIKPEFKSLPLTIDAVGVVTYDTRNIYSISSRVSGRVEKMYLKYAFQRVQKGEKVAEIYSPQLLTAQRELLYIIENDTDNLQLVESAKVKLELLGLTTSQVNDVVKRAVPVQSVPVYSPYTGYIILENNAPAIDLNNRRSTGGDPMDVDGMGSPTSSEPRYANDTEENLVREGDYLSTGQTLVRLVSAGALRIELNLVGVKTGTIDPGDKIRLTFQDGSSEDVSVDFVQPFFSKGQDFLKIRAYSKNRDLRIGALVSARVELAPTESIWVPRESVLDLGIDKVIFVKEREILTPRKITTGASSGKLIEVKTGLASSEEIAANAQYLVDSESFIKLDE
jgi:Cu(I)/Ag(I) efflux system membrane fusion protein